MPYGRSTNRRDFFRNCLAGAVALAAADGPLRPDAAEPGGPAAKSRVSIAQDPLLRSSSLQRVHIPAAAPAEGAVDSGRLLNLLDRAMAGLFPADEPTRAWSRIVRSGQTVGIKVNTLGGRGLSTSVPLVDAICERLQGAGIGAANIVVWDRDSTELERAGFHIRTGGNQVQCFGTDRTGYEDDLSSFGSVGSRVSRILTRRCDVLINVPVLKDHDGAGVSIALKNMYGTIHNPNKYHPNGCDPYVADVNMLTEIRSRLRLTVCDATSACYEGGPSFKPEFTWRHNALIVSQDPVALDTIGWQIIERKRREKGLKTLEADNRAPRYIATAADAEHRLGIDDPRRITLVESQVS